MGRCLAGQYWPLPGSPLGQLSEVMPVFCPPQRPLGQGLRPHRGVLLRSLERTATLHFPPFHLMHCVLHLSIRYIESTALDDVLEAGLLGTLGR